MIGILPGNRPQYIDHLVPLCDLLQIPLLVTDSQIFHLIQYYYPPLEIRLFEPQDFILDKALEGFDCFVYVDFSRLAHGTFRFHEYFTTRRASSLMSLHGNPDKYREIYWIERLLDEDMILAYGPHLVSLLEEKGVKKKVIISGNYRLEYYKKYRSFFDSKRPFNKEKTTILYAPTWSSSNRVTELKVHYSSFFSVYEELFDQVPSDMQLVVKLHPNMEGLSSIQNAFPDISFIQDYPLIYPLLKEVDIYIGDYSSIGYDFLYFDRPLFFLKTDKKTPLQSTGVYISDDIYRTIQTNLSVPFGEKRKALYATVYGRKKSLLDLRNEIMQCVMT